MKVLGWIFVGAGASIGAVSVPLRLEHPALTETELFIEYLPLWLTAAALALGGALLLWAQD